MQSALNGDESLDILLKSSRKYLKGKAKYSQEGLYIEKYQLLSIDSSYRYISLNFDNSIFIICKPLIKGDTCLDFN